MFDVRVPDSITTWYASGFGISKAAGIGVANPTEIRVFQPFFVFLSLPFSVIRGEDVTISTAVFSYLDGSCMAVSGMWETSFIFVQEVYFVGHGIFKTSFQKSGTE